MQSKKSHPNSKLTVTGPVRCVSNEKGPGHSLWASVIIEDPGFKRSIPDHSCSIGTGAGTIGSSEQPIATSGNRHELLIAAKTAADLVNDRFIGELF